MLKYIRIFAAFLIIAIISILIYKFRRQIPSPQHVVESIIPAPTTISDNGLPNKHQIKTIFVPQAPEKNWEQPWQDACEEAALLTVHYYYQNLSPSIDLMVSDMRQMFDFETKQGWGHDVNIAQMATEAAKLWAYQTEIIDNPTILDIKKYISKDIPVIVPANGKTLYKENKHFKSGGPWYHNLIILGYNDDTNKFTVHDVGTQFGSYFQYSYSLLMESIHDFPNSNKKEEINSAPPRVLVLLK